MNRITTTDGEHIYYRDWGKGEPVIFSHGWSLSSEAWDAQMFFLGRHGYRVIAYDRRGHGRSSQPWEGYDSNRLAEDLSALIDSLRLSGITLVAHGLGGGEIARYVSRYGTDKVTRMVFINAVTPLMLKTPGNPGGLPRTVFDSFRSGISRNRSQFYQELSIPYFGYNRDDRRATDGFGRELWHLAMQCSVKAAYDCIQAFSEEDFTEDLRKIDRPTLVLHGEADQIVPVQGSAVHTAEIIEKSTLRIIPGAPHGMCSTHSEIVNMELLSFFQRT